MKAEELFVGALARVNRDGLCIKKDTIVEVRGVDADDRLTEKGLVGDAHCRPLDENQFAGGIWCEFLEPIPLTPEILDKNGFRQDKKCPFVYETGDEDVIIDLYDPAPNARLSKKEDYDKMVGVRLSPEPPYGFSYWGQALMIRANYVHELQHALRLCGIEKEITM